MSTAEQTEVPAVTDATIHQRNGEKTTLETQKLTSWDVQMGQPGVWPMSQFSVKFCESLASIAQRQGDNEFLKVPESMKTGVKVEIPSSQGSLLGNTCDVACLFDPNLIKMSYPGTSAANPNCFIEDDDPIVNDTSMLLILGHKRFVMRPTQVTCFPDYLKKCKEAVLENHAVSQSLRSSYSISDDKISSIRDVFEKYQTRVIDMLESQYNERKYLLEMTHAALPGFKCAHEGSWSPPFPHIRNLDAHFARLWNCICARMNCSIMQLLHLVTMIPDPSKMPEMYEDERAPFLPMAPNPMAYMNPFGKDSGFPLPEGQMPPFFPPHFPYDETMFNQNFPPPDAVITHPLAFIPPMPFSNSMFPFQQDKVEEKIDYKDSEDLPSLLMRTGTNRNRKKPANSNLVKAFIEATDPLTQKNFE